MYSIVTETEKGGASMDVSPFGVKLRPASERKHGRAVKAYSMSFLETNSKLDQQLFVREFNQPLEASTSKSTNRESRNKWAAVGVPLRQRDPNNNNNASGANRQQNRSSCAFSSDAFYSGKDELNHISENAKPILRLWASKSKLNVEKRHSEIGTSSTSPELRRSKDVNSLKQGLQNTPWGKYFKPRSSSVHLRGENQANWNGFPHKEHLSVVSTVGSNLENSRKENCKSRAEDSEEKNTDKFNDCDIKSHENLKNTHKTLSRIERTEPKENIFPKSTGSFVPNAVFTTVSAEPIAQKRRPQKIEIVETNHTDNSKTEYIEDNNNNTIGKDTQTVITQKVPVEKKQSKEKQKDKENTPVKRLIRIKSLDLRDLHFHHRKKHHSNKDEETKSPSSSTPEIIRSDQNKERKHSISDLSKDKKHSSKAGKHDSRKSSNSKNKSTAKKSKVPSCTSEYIRVDYLQQPQKISNTKVDPLIDHIHDNNKSSQNNRTTRKSIDNSALIDGNVSIIYDAKERIERPRHFSLQSCDIDIDSQENISDRDSQKSYTDINKQITGGVFGTTKKPARSFNEEDKKIIESTDRNNIALVHTKSEPIVKTTQQHQEEDEEDSVFVSESVNVLHNNFKEDLIDEHNNTDTMSNQYKSNRFSTEPGSYLDSPSLKTTSVNSIEKSIYHSRAALEVYSFDDKYNLKNGDYSQNVLTANRNKFESCLDKCNGGFNTKKVRAASDCQTYSEWKSKDLLKNTEEFFPKSAYLRQRLQDLNEINSLSYKTQGRRRNSELLDFQANKSHRKLQRSATTSDDRFNPGEIDAFIKSYKDRHINCAGKTSQEHLNADHTSLRFTLENSQTSPLVENTNLTEKEESSKLTTNGEGLKKPGEKLSRDSRKSSSSDHEEMEQFFRRSSFGRSSASKSHHHDDNQSSSSRKSPFARNLSTRSSERSSRSISPIVDSPASPASPTSPTSRFKTPSIFSSVKRVHSAKISGAAELKLSVKKKDKNKSEENELNAGMAVKDSKADQPNDSAEKHGFSIFSSHKKKNSETSPPSPKQVQRKHSLTSYLGLKKNKEKERTVSPPTSPTLKSQTNNDSTENSSPASPPTHQKERRGSAFMKLFHKKSSISDVGDSKMQLHLEETIPESEQSKTTNSRSRGSIKISAKSVSKSNDTTTPSLPRQHEESQAVEDTAQEKEGIVKTRNLSITINGVKKSADEKEFLVQSGGSDGYVHVDQTNPEMESTIKNILNEKPDVLSPSDTVSRGEKPEVESTQEKRERRRDRRMQGLDTNDLNTVLGTSDQNESNGNNLSVPPANGDFGSSESLYDSDCGSKRTSRNKERIRSRKAARKEAQERHKSLPAGIGDIEIDFSSANNADELKPNINGSQTSVTSNAEPHKTRKKHKARRANTEFIVNVPNLDLEGTSPQMSLDDGIVLRRNNKRNMRRDRPKTLTAGISSELIFGFEQNESNDGKSGVVNENLSFAEIKKKLLEGLTDDQKVPEKMPQKERQKIKRTKSSKRYKTITEGIAPRDLELAKQAIEAEHTNNGNRNVIDKDTLAQITAALTSTSDKRKSFIVESRPGSRYTSQENLNLSNPDLTSKTESAPAPRPLHRTKSMTTMHLELDKNEDDPEEIEIKPLSELKNRFLMAMEETKQKHLSKKTPIEIKRRNKGRSRQDRPHTICGLDDYTMEQLQNEIGNAPDSDLKKKEESKTKEESVFLTNTQTKKNPENDEVVARTIQSELNSSTKREKKKYQRVNSKKLFDDLQNDIDDILDDGLSESDLAELMGCNPSLHQGSEKVELNIVGNKEQPKTNNTTEEVLTNGKILSDLDYVSSQSSLLSSSLASDKRNIKPKRKQRTGANPIKSLQLRDDLVDETEIANQSKEDKKSQHPVVEAYRGLKQTADQKSSNPAERYLKRDLADEAVHALRATVDFSKTKLRKVEAGQKASTVLSDNFVPSEFTNLLLQVKGRKKVQTTVVEFHPKSLNSNDCYILITPKELICWHGAQANVIERAKAAEIASRISQKKEMGCKALDVLYLDQGANDMKVIRLLGGNTSNDADLKCDTLPDDDFEKTMTSTYMTYEVCEAGEMAELVPMDLQCHRMPSKEILSPDSAFVFDFITEVYVWLGRQTSSQQRKTIQDLAAKKFEEGYHPLILEASLSHLPHLGKPRKISVTANASHRASKGQRRVSTQQGRHQKREVRQRPDHSLLLQLFEASEWVIFKEKFCDWPDESRIIRMKGGPSSVGEISQEVSTAVSIDIVDPKTMVDPAPAYKMILENVDIGRGLGIPKGMDGYHIITLDVKTWHVSENNSILMPDASFGQFHSGEGYVIRWQYRVVKVRAVRNCDDIMKAGGMERCCYFFWLGNDCSVNEEGATAVMTIELDKEKGPQVRVVLGKEPPALLNLFDGCMIIHAGKRPAPGIRSRFSDQSVMRLYCVRHEEPSEACLLQVPAMCESLRSKSSFVLLLCSQGEIFLWHGCRSNEGTRKTAQHAAQMLIQNHPVEAAIGEKTEIGFQEFEEGDEPDVFWLALGGKEDYGSLLGEDEASELFSPRLFHLECTADVFTAFEITSPGKTQLFHCPFPVLQDDMYNVEQPAIFLLDAKTHIYLWFGWWPDEAETEASMSRRRRWGEERRKAMESAVAYANEVGRSLNTMYSVHAGLEPESFIELFPYWVVQEDITDLQIDEGLEEDRLYKITEELQMFTKEFYTIEELMAKPPPQSVDPTKLEKYLSEEDFLAVFKFHKPTFYKLPVWQQTNWKKKVGLY